MRMRSLLVSLLVLLGVAPAAAHAAALDRDRWDAQASAHAAATRNIPVSNPGPPPGARVLKYRFGPIKVKPGQNLIDIDVQRERPNVDGWIVSFRPDLVYHKTNRKPSVRQVHLHHAVWLVDLQPTFAAGEEKTYFNAPPGYGWRYTTRQSWLINHMVHDLTGQEAEVDIVYTIYFIPDTAPEAAGIKEIKTQWMDVEGLKPYPVFDALRGRGKNGRFTYPDDAKNAYPDGKIRNRWVADRDATLVIAGGHLHPGGLWVDLKVTRGDRTVRIFRSRANYYEPAGAVSWDVSMSVTTPNWKVAVKKGDVLSVSATYDTRKASWYEVMGIMVVGITNGPDGGVDPFSGQVDQTDRLSHGRLPENIETGVGRKTLAYNDPRTMRTGPMRSTVTIRNFMYLPGDLSLNGRQGLPPAVPQGRSLTFINRDEPTTVRFHTVTSCKLPCNRTPGIKFPLADGGTIFDSGELGYGLTISTLGLFQNGDAEVPITAAVPKRANSDRCIRSGVSGLVRLIGRNCVGTTRWKTPKNLKPGTYAYFCRIHPFMRGSFRVVPKTKLKR
jgi:hypothetical protein